MIILELTDLFVGFLAKELNGLLYITPFKGLV